MAKASLKLPNGPVITLEGTPEEVKQLLEIYSGEEQRGPRSATRSSRIKSSKTSASTLRSAKDKNDGKPDLNKIVTLAKDCNEAETIEKQILDRTAQVDRTLLPLYIVHEYLHNAFGLTSG